MVTNSIHINATACCTNINNIIGYRRATPFTFTSIKRCLQPYMHVQKKSQRKSLNHARRTSIRPGHHRHFIGFQAGSDVPEPGRSAAASPRSQPRVKAKPPFANVGFRLVPVSKSWLPSVSLRSLYVMLPGWVEKKTRSYLIYLAGPLHIRLPVSAAPHTLLSVC